MKLCGFCLAAVFPRNVSMCGSARTQGEWEPIGLNVSNVGELVKSGALIYNAAGQPMMMKAVTMVHGSYVCAQHAIEAARMAP